MDFLHGRGVAGPELEPTFRQTQPQKGSPLELFDALFDAVLSMYSTMLFYPGMTTKGHVNPPAFLILEM